MPVWGVWLENSFYFSTSATSRKGRNLAVNPYCTITVSRHAIDIIVEGMAAPVADESTLHGVAARYSQKYETPLTVRDGAVYVESGDGGPLYKLTPTVAFGFCEDGEFSATRWRF